MSRLFYLSDSEINIICERIKEEFSNKKLSGDSPLIKYVTEATAGKATMKFTEKAWNKMQLLISKYPIEIEWHGLVKRENTNTFLIYDVLVSPHEITATSCTADQAKYEDWFNSLSEEQQRDLRFHGHSHVNMNVTPSAVDTTYRADIISTFGKPTEGTDKFYLFAIFNKKGDITGEIFDLTNNIVYSTKDIDFVYLPEENGYIKFLDGVEKVVVEKKYQYSPGFYGGYKDYRTPSYVPDNKGKSSKWNKEGKNNSHNTYNRQWDDDEFESGDNYYPPYNGYSGGYRT